MDNFNLRQYLTENKLLKEETKVVMYTSYIKSDWKPEFKNGMIGKKGKGANGTSENKPVILCSKEPFMMVDNEGEEVPYINVEFEKNLNEIYIDKDDYDLDEFGIEAEEAWDFVKDNPKPSLQDLTQFDLSLEDGYSFYGCYVEDIKLNEIIKIKEGEF